jgi:arylsulfatase A-like enzyme
MTKQQIKDIMFRHKFNLEYRIRALEKLVEFNNSNEVEKEYPDSYAAQAGSFRAMIRYTNDEVTRALKDLNKINEAIEEIILEGQEKPKIT